MDLLFFWLLLRNLVGSLFYIIIKMGVFVVINVVVLCINDVLIRMNGVLFFVGDLVLIMLYYFDDNFWWFGGFIFVVLKLVECVIIF